MKKEKISIRWHSRAGQGAITVSNFLAENFVKLNYKANSFPDFGAEKRGASVKVFNKISKTDEDFILDVSQPQIVEAVVLFDVTLAKAELGYDKIIEGLSDEGFLLINSNQASRSKKWINFSGKVFHIDGSGIALSTIKRDIPNVSIAGALTKILDIDFAKSRENLKENLSKFFSEKIVEVNLESFERGYKEVKKVF